MQIRKWLYYDCSSGWSRSVRKSSYIVLDMLCSRVEGWRWSELWSTHVWISANIDIWPLKGGVQYSSFNFQNPEYRISIFHYMNIGFWLDRIEKWKTSIEYWSFRSQYRKFEVDIGYRILKIPGIGKKTFRGPKYVSSPYFL